MTSALTPRDIQTRIRSGASLEDVVRESGMPAERVEAFAAPVLAEREHVAGSALQCPVRRRGETGSVRAMRAVVAEKLAAAHTDVDDVEWDAWRNEDRKWTVVGRWQADGQGREARFIFDQRARFSVAANDAARELIGEVTAAPAPRPVTAPSVRMDPADAEPTIDLQDELAVLRAAQGEAAVTAPTVTEPASTVTEPTPEQGQPTPAEPVAMPEPVEDDDEEPQDYSPAELEEVDGVYDLVPQNSSEMDVLYEMLSSFAEDSVNIYAGLANPVIPEPTEDLTKDVTPAAEPTDEPEAPEESLDVLGNADRPEEATAAEPVGDEATTEAEPVEASASMATEPVEASEPGEAEDEQAEHSALIALPDQAPVAVPAAPVVVEVAQPEPDENTVEVQLPADEAPAEPDDSVAPEEPLDKLGDRGVPADEDADPAAEPVEAPAEPEQDALVEAPEQSEPAPKPRPKPRPRKKRASIPSWDEIMFGGPVPPKKD
ncbi:MULTISPECIES: septation protein SepH [unclassified Luteococcus]|uniref:septation protein SepH n=1 Tax=unclassified Luteococcus TaxID=2639923 RepID=UPI00313BE2A3